MKETNVFHAALKRYTLLTYLLTYLPTDKYITSVFMLRHMCGFTGE